MVVHKASFMFLYVNIIPGTNIQPLANLPKGWSLIKPTRKFIDVPL